MAAPELVSHDDGHVRMLTLNRPQRHNAFTPAGYRTLAESLRAAAADDEVHVVMLSGAGPGFCSGVDLAALSHAGSDLAAFDTAFHALLDALTTFPKPLLAAVHGSAVGFGFTILLHCDVVLVADDARMSAPFAALGTTRHSADEAVGWGLAARVVPRAALAVEGQQLAQSIAAQPPAAVSAAKRLLLRAREGEVKAAIREERRGAGAVGETFGGLMSK